MLQQKTFLFPFLTCFILTCFIIKPHIVNPFTITISLLILSNGDPQLLSYVLIRLFFAELYVPLLVDQFSQLSTLPGQLCSELIDLSDELRCTVVRVGERTPSWPIIMELNLNVRGAVSLKLNLNQGKSKKNYLVFFFRKRGNRYTAKLAEFFCQKVAESWGYALSLLRKVDNFEPNKFHSQGLKWFFCVDMDQQGLKIEYRS